MIQMSTSLIGNVIDQGNIMVQSLDPTMLSSPTSKVPSELNTVRSVVPQLNGESIYPLLIDAKLVKISSFSTQTIKHVNVL